MQAKCCPNPEFRHQERVPAKVLLRAAKPAKGVLSVLKKNHSLAKG